MVVNRHDGRFPCGVWTCSALQMAGLSATGSGSTGLGYSFNSMQSPIRGIHDARAWPGAGDSLQVLLERVRYSRPSTPEHADPPPLVMRPRVRSDEAVQMSCSAP